MLHFPHPSVPLSRFRLSGPLRLTTLTTLSAVAAAAAMLLLAGCTTVGPDYQGAPAVASDALQQSRFKRDDASTGATTQTSADAPAPVAAQWWRALGDATLDGLVEQALNQSPTLQAAEARLRSARAAFNEQEANGRPKGSASALGAGVWQGPGTDHESSLHLYSVGFDATWEVDLFGGTRRAVESASAQAQAVQADLADAQVSLTAEVASTYVGLRAQQRRQALLRDTAAFDAQALTLVRQRRDQGVASADDVEQRAQQGEATQASLADVAADIAASLDRLALLTGQAPGALDEQLGTSQAEPLALPHAPDSVAIGDPASLLQRRPDIRAAERRLAGRNAQIGQEKAKYFPKLSLLGNIGVAGTNPGKLLRTDNLALAAVPYLSWNFLDFGRTAAAVREAEAGRDEAVANYKAAVLGALQDANTSLARFGRQRQSVQHLLAQQGSTARTLDLTRQRRQAGAASQIDLLDAQRRDTDARLKALDGESALLKDFVALQKSLGLGWDLPA
ncbi:efflux transporter outer membrane subunit [Roseateles chitinivorans]|uniref:efflux transporter outer membrane subunit n=1 Tax=Roseateles chitinivorans TaxID=2917965 RepID=UPI003D66FD38